MNSNNEIDEISNKESRCSAKDKLKISIDSSTASYLKGQISFQEFESLDENLKIQSELDKSDSFEFLENDLSIGCSSSPKKYNSLTTVKSGGNCQNSQSYSPLKSSLQNSKNKDQQNILFDLKNKLNINQYYEEIVKFI